MEAYAAGENWDGSTDVPESAILYEKEGYSPDNGYFATDRTVLIISKIEPGWHEISGNWYFCEDDRVFVTGWIKDSGNWYYFDEEGIMKTGWLADGGKWYYLSASGAMATGWQQIDGNYYFFKSNGVMAADEYCGGYYLDKNGVWSYQAKASWKSDSKGTYYQDTKGWYPKNRWLLIDGQWYFFKSDGYMASSEYCNGYWLNSDGTRTYQYKASWKKDSKGWWYGDDNGWYAKNESLKIDGKIYNFDVSGYCTNP